MATTHSLLGMNIFTRARQLERPVLCLMGPTAMGKSDIALALAHHFPMEIVSVDSFLVYRGMDIGTAKPSAMSLASVPHHLINICDPKESYSVGRFYGDVRQIITAILARGKIPLLVGGTMMYFYALQHGLAELPLGDKIIRARLQQELLELGVVKMYERLMEVDPLAAARIDRHDWQRIQRALEVYELTQGVPLSFLQRKQSDPASVYDFINLILVPARLELLRARIHQRFQKMLELGFIAEVESLYTSGQLTDQTPSMRAIGYREVWSYLSGELGYLEMVRRVPLATAQLAKRQITWLKKWPDAHWLAIDFSEEQLFQQLCDRWFADG